MIMRTLKLIKSGLNLRAVKLSAYAWLYNLCLSFIIYFGFYMVFSISAGKSMIAEHMEMYGFFTTLMDIFNNFRGSFTLVVSISFYFIILYIASSIFISAGIFSVLIEEEKADFFTLFSASIENFFKFLKVFLINTLNFAFALLPLALMALVFWKTLERSLNETLFTIFIVLFLVFAVVLLVFSVAVYDFSRIIRLKEGRNFLFSFREGIRFVFSHKKKILFLFLLYIFASALFYIAFKLFLGIVGEWLGLIFLFMIFQTFILLRYFLKIVLIAGEFELIRAPFREEG
jgi:hypothetical protein